MKKNSGKLTKILMGGGVGLGLLSSNLASAGHGVGMPGIMQYNGTGGVISNQPDNLILGYDSIIGQSFPVYLNHKNTLQEYGLSPIGGFYRGEKFFKGGLQSYLNSPSSFHYSNYNKEQEGGKGRHWVYGVWEGRGGVYNLYDPKGEKWGECVPYYIAGTNRVLDIYSGRYVVGKYNQRYYYINNKETKDILTDIYNNTTSTNNGGNYSPYTLTENNKKFFSAMFFGKYNVDSLGMQFHIPYVIDEQGIKQKDINLISNAGHLNGMLNPDDVNFDFTFY